MFLIDKYTPKVLDDAFFHGELLNMLKTMSTDESIPHMIFYGPPGSGKKTIINLFLEMIYDKDVHQLEDCVYKVVGSGNKITEVVVKQSNYHIIIEPNNNNFDRYLIQDIVKEYAKRIPLDVFKTKKVFKTVLINCVDNLSYYAQTSLRRTMEKYSGTCRFIMWCRSLSRVIDPLKSRCLCFRVASPTYAELFEWVLTVCAYENIKLSLKDNIKIVEEAKGNIKFALWNIELLRSGLFGKNMYLQTVKQISDLICEVKIDNLQTIRTLLYNVMITNVSSTEIIKDVMFKICESPLIQNESKYKIIEITAKYEHNLTRGRRDIVHLIGFVATTMKIIFDERNKVKVLENN